MLGCLTKGIRFSMAMILPLLLTLFCISGSMAQTLSSDISIIPEPVRVTRSAGTFRLPPFVTLNGHSNSELMPILEFLKEKIILSGHSVLIDSKGAGSATLELSLNSTPNAEIGSEGYQLSVSEKKITITANQASGLYYGAQSLLQLFPKEIEGTEIQNGIHWELPCVEITDYPRLAWRGLMLDVARHFFTKNEVKQYIDQMARYKFNLLHLHLTDDEGWRIEIKSLPRLTTVGAFNVKKIGQFGSFSKPKKTDARDYGGFYTQDDIRELIAYASERFVNILPEIDVPGHSLAAVVAYPEISISPSAAKNYSVISGENMTADNTLDPSNEATYEFMDKVVTEMAALFPFAYLHLGGDECMKDAWKKSVSVTALMKKEKLKTYEAVQGYFERRLQKIVESKNKKFMAWDEVLEGGIDESAGIMSWRGLKIGLTAAQQNHPVIMSPTEFTYLDYMQSDSVNEPHVYASLRLNKTYQFEPIPAGANEKMILGGQANLWTEQVFNFRQVQYMTWPRAFAIAETLWSPADKKDWNHFYPKVEKQFERFDQAEIKYASSLYTPIFDAKENDQKELEITLSSELSDIDYYYSFDNSLPDRFYPKYESKLIAPEDATQLKVVAYRGKKMLGQIVTMPIATLHRRFIRNQ